MKELKILYYLEGKVEVEEGLESPRWGGLHLSQAGEQVCCHLQPQTGKFRTCGIHGASMAVCTFCYNCRSCNISFRKEDQLWFAAFVVMEATLRHSRHSIDQLVVQHDIPRPN